MEDASSSSIVYAPVFETRTWQDRVDRLFSEDYPGKSAETVTHQDKIDAGWTRYLQPVPNPVNDYNDPTLGTAPSYVEKIIDLFADLDVTDLIPGTRCTLTIEDRDIVPGVMISTYLAASVDGNSWDEASEGTQAFFSGFRYIRIRVYFDNPLNDRLAYTLIEEIRLRLDVKQKTTQGTFIANASDVGGTFVNFPIDFLDVDSVVATPEDDELEVFTVVQFEDIPFPNGFFTKVFDVNGNRITTRVSYVARGV